MTAPTSGGSYVCRKALPVSPAQHFLLVLDLGTAPNTTKASSSNLHRSTFTNTHYPTWFTDELRV